MKKGESKKPETFECVHHLVYTLMGHVRQRRAEVGEHVYLA